jgi:hypothetical protein
VALFRIHSSNWVGLNVAQFVLTWTFMPPLPASPIKTIIWDRRISDLLWLNDVRENLTTNLWRIRVESSNLTSTDTAATPARHDVNHAPLPIAHQLCWAHLDRLMIGCHTAGPSCVTIIMRNSGDRETLRFPHQLHNSATKSVVGKKDGLLHRILMALPGHRDTVS